MFSKLITDFHRLRVLSLSCLFVAASGLSVQGQETLPSPLEEPLPPLEEPLPPLEEQPIAPVQTQPVTVPNQNLNQLATETDYTLGAGDLLRLDVFQVPEYSGEYLVLVDGTVSLPLVGTLDVRGLTLGQMIDRVSNEYARYLRQPIVTVSLVAPRPLKIGISGEINSPGSYTVPVDRKFPTITDLIQLAGGVTTAADIRQVEVRRFFQGKEQIVSVNLWELLQQGNLSQDLFLRDGDTIVIPTAETISTAENLQLDDANFGIRGDLTLNVAVVGEVNRPGSYKIAPAETGENIQTRAQRLTQAIQQAGGIKPLADLRNVQVIRSTRIGVEQTIEVDLWNLLQTGDIQEDVILQEGDRIIIPTAEEIPASEAEAIAQASFAPAVMRVNVVGEVRAPGVVEVPSNTPLNQALMAAGSFNVQRANRGSVDLIRLNPNGTVTKRKIEIDLAADLNEENNPMLKNNDVIIVSRTGFVAVVDTIGLILSPFNTITASVTRLF
ncbi:MAG: SLBB domain-containing protein [Gomphosphaeria aponina SAG 52.96 = DSM 107014]|uniref:SLBB domain-containing protein n=1 Tax=Gomphosphaeria aponina SAG 52.96 = DSM 107014 TaxID=1521640 RepID=A0A941GQW5_9CHRO|nr:SLBB domain-containing protein [Gomphosphaeria aponina SAG 52.96 = DSM 107014]